LTYSRILGTGSYLPDRILTNADLEKLIDTNDQWIVDRTGIRERHIAAEGEFTSDLATVAARAALDAAGLAIDDIDLLLVATTTA
jgi:3-oxoacyl-[acyl-carrier-protein] synthase-3